MDNIDHTNVISSWMAYCSNTNGARDLQFKNNKANVMYMQFQFNCGSYVKPCHLIDDGKNIGPWVKLTPT